MWDKAASADSVAGFGCRAMERGQLLVIKQVALSFMDNWIFPLLQRRMALRISHSFMKKS
jgi:hypothetical protein